MTVTLAQQRNLNIINVADFNVFPTNPATLNDTNIANAIAALPSNGPGTLLFPCIGTGIYNISQSIIIDKDNIALVAFGQRGTVTIQIDPSADPTWALIAGNTKNVQSCLIDGLTFVGRNSGSSTGGGILFRSNQGKIRQSKVALFGKQGVSVIAFSGTLFEVYGEDIDLVQNGLNTIAHDDNLYIDSTVSDCEYHRVISLGNSAKNTTRNGINNLGNQQKFVNCHCYWASNDGFSNSGAGTQISGGEYETNGANGIESMTQPGLNVSGVAGFGNINTDIAAYGKAIITKNTLSSTVFQNIYVNSASGGVISDNVLSGAQNAMQLDTGASGYNVHDNSCSATTASVINTKSTNSAIHDNTILGGGNIVEQTGAQGNNIHSNTLIGGGTITQIGTSTRIKNNVGFNPRGFSVTQPAVPASTVAVTNTTGCDCTVLVKGGTLTVINIGGSATGISAAAAAGSVHSVRVPAGQTISITYTVAPTWTWFGD